MTFSCVRAACACLYAVRAFAPLKKMNNNNKNGNMDQYPANNKWNTHNNNAMMMMMI